MRTGGGSTQQITDSVRFTSGASVLQVAVLFELYGWTKTVNMYICIDKRTIVKTFA